MRVLSVLLMAVLVAGCSSNDTPDPAPSSESEPPPAAAPTEHVVLPASVWVPQFCQGVAPLLNDGTVTDPADTAVALEKLGAPQGNVEAYEQTLEALQVAVVSDTEETVAAADTALQQMLSSDVLAGASSCDVAPQVTEDAAVQAAQSVFEQMVSLNAGQGTLRDPQLLFDAALESGVPAGFEPAADFSESGQVLVVFEETRACMLVPNTVDDGVPQIVPGPCSSPDNGNSEGEQTTP